MIHLKKALFMYHMSNPKKALEEKKGENPIEIQADIKIKKSKGIQITQTLMLGLG